MPDLLFHNEMTYYCTDLHDSLLSPTRSVGVFVGTCDNDCSRAHSDKVSGVLCSSTGFEQALSLFDTESTTVVLSCSF